MNDNRNFEPEEQQEQQTAAQAPEQSPAAAEDDDFIIGRGFTVADPQDTEPVAVPAEKRRKKSRKGRHGPVYYIVWIAAIVIVSCSIAFGAVYVGADFLGVAFGRDGSEVTFEITPGSSTQRIAAVLEENGVVKCPFVFRLYAKLRHYDGQFKYGVYTVRDDSGYEVIAEKLMTEGAQAETAEVTIPEMATVDEIAALLEEKGVCTASDFKYEVQYGNFNYDFIGEIPAAEVHYRLEGYLFPETYSFYSYDSEECAHLAVDKMLATFEERISGELRRAYESNEKYSFHELVTMASMIEAEAGNASDDDRARVAQVFYNRLEGINWEGPNYLQSDPTTKYPYGGGRYDTYKSAGLPPGPTCSPSLRSLKAAANPDAGTKATYFVTDSDGVFYFNETLAAHNKTVADLKAAGKWVYSTLG